MTRTWAGHLEAGLAGGASSGKGVCGGHQGCGGAGSCPGTRTHASHWGGRQEAAVGRPWAGPGGHRLYPGRLDGCQVDATSRSPSWGCQAWDALGQAGHGGVRSAASGSSDRLPRDGGRGTRWPLRTCPHVGVWGGLAGPWAALGLRSEGPGWGGWWVGRGRLPASPCGGTVPKATAICLCQPGRPLGRCGPELCCVVCMSLSSWGDVPGYNPRHPAASLPGRSTP